MLVRRLRVGVRIHAPMIHRPAVRCHALFAISSLRAMAFETLSIFDPKRITLVILRNPRANFFPQYSLRGTSI